MKPIRSGGTACPASLSRRAAVAGTAAVIAGGIAPAAHAQTPLSQDNGAIWMGRYWAVKQAGDRKIWLAMYRKRLGAPVPGEARRPILFLVHGSSNSSLTSFDLSVPGHGEFSMMNVFARLGYDVWTLDHENYGASSRTDSNSDIASGVEDLKAGGDLVARETGQGSFHMLGESSGALRAGAFAMARPDRVERLVLEAFTYTGQGSPTLADRAKQLDYYRTHNRRLRDRAMIQSIFTRDKPGTTDPAVADALADAELVYGDTVPTGTYLDMTANLPVVDPTRVTCPVMLVKGEYEGISSLDDLYAFFKQLPNGSREITIIAGAAHALTFAKTRAAFWHAVHAFLTTLAPAEA